MKHIKIRIVSLPQTINNRLKVKKNVIQSFDYMKNRASWMSLVFLFIVVIYSNIAYAGKNGNLLFNDMTLGGPLTESVNAEFSANLSNILQNDSLPTESILTSQQSNILATVNAPEGYVAGDDMRLVREYLVQEGDTLQSIAERFSISPETVAIENNIQKQEDIKPGITLNILPTDGIKYVININSDLEEVVTKYDLTIADVLAFNNIADESDLSVGSELVLPGAKVPDSEKPELFKPKTTVTRSKTRTVSSNTAVPSISGYYGYPTTGRNYGRIHSNNGVDISNSCGTPIVASADGFINTSQDGWNGGYGSYIKITHPNGTETVYAHLSVRNYGVGTQVTKGQVIGLMGTTGRSTGCHLHFEVRGARNPLGNY
jgi:murein DD-endopeptidase MepM/ murein hydrolase activator NlpD